MGEIQVPVLDNAGQRRIEESVPAEALGPGRYRLLGSPGLVEGVAAGDEIELAPEEPAGFRVVRRGGQLCIWVYVPDPPPPGTEARLTQAARALGGFLDGGQTRLRVLTLPVIAGFPAVEAELNAAVAELGATWAYGNVYQSGDASRPLGWWAESL